MMKHQWFVYLVQCSDQSLYCGITNNLKNRLAAHNSGKGAIYTRSRRPVVLVAASSGMTRRDALKLEYRVKQVPAGQKEGELTKSADAIVLDINQKALQAVSRQVKTYADMVEKMIAQTEGSGLHY